MKILVFKTNIRYKKTIRQIIPYLDRLPGVQRWNFDLHDKDNILRIETHDLSPRVVESTLQQAGYSCEELE